ncbi:Uncharacterized SAM-binding protein YcdF, DUF218 family [Rhizobium sp. RU20A]|uniref:YdcF family protein n=1 Tax=Rhizobium sp. RU20A TaxID=1907412 RepID=UPI00095609DF|nr:YdcF family protein [Rhizobium sp. RU20A]SIQ74970.1 Uncharacterized SAM-binding protein YcdF, DUF218 family [Rhizobium sp. RU20A]
MFLISKLVWLVLQPLSLVFLLLVSGLIFMRLGLGRSGVGIIVLATLVLFVTLFTTSGTVALQALENRFQRQAPLAAGERCIIVLGGAFENEVIAARGGIELNQAGDRFVETVLLARENPAARILVSGGDGSFSGAYQGDAAVARDFFGRFGIDPNRIIEEGTSRTTSENASNTVELLRREGLDDCLLVTSAFHMPRAVGLFRKMGVGARAWPTDYRTTGRARLGFDFTQPSLNAQLATTAAREWVGLLAYYLAGRTHTVFPHQGGQTP